MAVNNNLTDFIQAIVDAVASKTGDTTINAQELPSKIKNISTTNIQEYFKLKAGYSLKTSEGWIDIKNTEDPTDLSKDLTLNVDNIVVRDMGRTLQITATTPDDLDVDPKYEQFKIRYIRLKTNGTENPLVNSLPDTEKEVISGRVEQFAISFMCNLS